MQQKDGSYLYGNWSNGIGISENDQQGFDTIVGLDIHSKPGTITGSKACENLDLETPIIDALCTCKVKTPAGDSYFGATNGKIFKVTSAGVVSLVNTVAAAPAITGIGYFNGYLYYSYSNKLGRFDGVSTWADTWATFTNTHTNPRHMVATRLSLYITDTYLIAAVDLSGAFSANVLDLDPTQVAVAVAVESNGILIGSTSGWMFWWDTYSSSWSIDDLISEGGVNAFIPTDNLNMIQAGTVGNIYYWNGSKAVLWSRLRDSDTLVTTAVNPYASDNLNGLPLFGTTRGIYSLGTAHSKLPVAQVIEYVSSLGQGTQIGAVCVVGSQVFSSFKNSTSYGIDKLSTNKYSGFFITPIAEGKLAKLRIGYDSIPTGTSLTATVSVDSASLASHTIVKDDSNDRVYYSENGFNSKSTVKAKVVLVASTTYSPVIRKIKIH